MRIQHNITAMNAYRNYNLNTKRLAGNLEKLSSGYKINRAGDDAAGLAISEKMRAQITGLDAAQKNVKDGTSLVKTAEGAMQEIQDMLNRMSYLATQSANGTYQNEVDRENLQAEVEQLKEEINRIADSANFNGIKLLDGSMEKDYSATTAGESIDLGAALATNTVDGTPTTSGTGMILKQEGDATGTKTSVTVNLQNLALADAADGSTVKLSIGGKDFELTVNSTKTAGWDNNDNKYYVSAADVKDATALAAAFKGAFDGIKTADADKAKLGATGKEQAFTATANGTTITFEQESVPNDANEVVSANMAATVTFTAAAGGGAGSNTGTAGVYSTKVTTAFADGETLTIGGKTIKFKAGGTGADEINVTTADDASKQAAAIKDMFDGDANWTVAVDAGDDTKLTFTQKTASTTNALTVTTGAAGAVTGAMAADSTAKDTYAAGTEGSYTLDVTQFAVGESVTIDGVTMKFIANGGTPATGSNEVALGADADGTAAAIKDYLDGKTTNVTVTVDAADASKLVLTEKVAGSLGDIQTTAPTAPAVTKEIAGAPTYSETTVADAGGNGEWTIDLSGLQASLNAGDTFTIGGKTFEYNATTATGTALANGNISIQTNIADDEAIATAVVNAITGGTGNSGADGMTYEVDTGTTTQINIAQGTADAADITLADSLALTTATSNGTTGSLTVGDASKGTAGTAASHEAALTTALAAGEQLKITVDGNDYIIGASSGGDIDTDSATAVSDQLDAIVTYLNGVNGFNNTDYVAGKSADSTKLIIAQKAAADPAAGGKDPSFSAEVTKAASGAMSTVNEDTAPVDPTGGNGAAGGATGTYNVSTTKNTQGAPKSAAALASTTLDLGALKTKIEDGATLTIGEETYTFAVGKDSSYKDAENVIDLTKYDSVTDDAIIDAGMQLSNKDGEIFDLGFNQTDKKLSIHEHAGQSKYSVEKLGTVEAFKSHIYMNKAGTETKGEALKLQIGDTSDPYNQMEVSIKDMHVKSMGKAGADGKVAADDSIANINIGTREGASKAIDVIKNAINYVSSVRGTLGAAQNRLDHTANNLSVMSENIQDAESTIRDTDVAAEMMSYVKNNILVQSAQAMLAQANQLPQGVLQLLG